MTLETHVVMEGSPEFKLQAKLKPTAFEAGGEGSLKVVTGPITARVEEIPISLTIPFLRRGGGVVMVASIGVFGVRLDPIEAKLQAFGVRFDGVLGKDGMEGSLEGTVACRMELDLAGTLPGRVAEAAIEKALEE